jgi:hypothetical protein
MKIETNMATYNSILAQYMSVSKLTPDEVLEKKGRDLGIKLFQGFRDHKLGKGIAKAELLSRTAAGDGTRVRPSLLAEYLAKRTEVRSALKSFIGPLRSRDVLKSIKTRVRLWQSFVGREVKLRQRGAGVLGASFLWYRSRTNQAQGRHFVKNRTGRPLGYVEKGQGFLRIVGLTDGLTLVDSRYNIVATKVAEATSDMVVYVNQKQSQLGRALFGGQAA